MTLFNSKVLARAGATISSVPEKHAKALAHWAGMVRSGEILRHKETALDGDFKTGIVEGVLGYRPAGHVDGQTVDKEHLIGAGRVDLALGRFGGTGSDEIAAPFELKGAKTRDLDAPMAGRNISPVEQAWDYALLIGRSARWVLITNYVEIRLYSYREGIPLGERSDWEDWLATSRRQINAYTATIAAAEREIDAIVYELFGMSTEEITLLEANV